MQHRPSLTVIGAAIAASAATLLLAVAPALLSVPDQPRDALRQAHTVELPRVVVTARRDAPVVELPRVVIEARREAARTLAGAGAGAGAGGGGGAAQPVLAPRGF